MNWWDRHYRADGRDLDLDAGLWRGPDGGLLDLVGGEPRVDPAALTGRGPDLWRYREALPFAPGAPWPGRVSFGEGMTPLVEVDLEGTHLHAKLEYVSPTLSFKDRGAVVLVAKLAELGATDLVIDSSGNAGTAVAAYAARAGMACRVLVPASTSPAKTRQARAHGAEVVVVDGDRAATAAAARADVERSGASYASHVYNPFFLEGTKTYAFELWEQLGRAPDVCVLPAGNGTLVLGAARGFDELVASGLIDRSPRIVAVQAETCAPVTQAHRSGGPVVPVDDRGTVAEGIAITDPPRGDQMLDAVRRTGGTFVTVTDAQIIDARARLARRGIAVEPTGAVAAAAAIFCPVEVGGGLVVAPMCGAGLKSET